ncbi:PIR protein [Plasmodium vivax]|nr:PIR protein [Plasmodium vivax]
MSTFLGKIKLNNLRTKHYYYNFDNEIGECDGDVFIETAKSELAMRNELLPVSEKILKALCFVYKRSMRQNFDKDICKFFYFWLGNILLNKLEKRKRQFYTYIISNIFKSLNSAGNGKVCELPHFYIHENDFDNVKRIFDYSEDYSSYKIQLTEHYPPCNSDYKSYLDAYVETYKKLSDECAATGYHTGYCKEFHYYFQGKDENLLSTWKCNLHENDPRDHDLGEEEKEADDETLKGVEQIPSNSRIESHDVQSDHGLASVGALRAGHFRSAAPGLDTETSLMGRPSSPTDASSPSITSKSITGAVSVAGILVPSYLMYNYTSAGTWINKVLGRKTRTNFNPYTDQFLMANISGPENFYSERSRYNISYRPE